MSMCVRVTLLSGILLLIGCGESESTKQRRHSHDLDETAKAEGALMADSNKAGPALIKRLRENVSAHDGLLRVKTMFGMSVLPINSPWAVYCGIGITVVFGSSFSGYRDSIRNDFEINLTTANLYKSEKCDVLAPLLGREIQVILTEN